MRKERVLEALRQLAPAGSSRGATASEVAEMVGIRRNNASADLNELVNEGLALKLKGRPVRFVAVDEGAAQGAVPPLEHDPFQELVGCRGSLSAAVEQAKAAMLYPPRGLPTLISGPTGSGKSRLAEAMYRYAVAAGRLPQGAPFCVFNCADYAANPQLLQAQLFGYVKGAFTGAERDTPGLVAEADGGLLFLDEIHRLPPDGQEMLFLLMDRGIYRALGETTMRQASVMLVGATSEDPSSSLLNTFVRRFPVVIHLPELDVRPMEERLALIEVFFREEASRIGIPIAVSPLVLLALLAYRTTGNVGELRSAILMACAKAFFGHMAAGSGESGPISLDLTHLSPQIQLAYLQGLEPSGDAERLVGVEDRVYMPSALHSEGRYPDEYVPTDLYAQLHRRVAGYLRAGLQESELRRVIRTDLDYYLRRLLHRANRTGLVPNHLLNIVTEFVRDVGEELNEKYGSEVVTGLALHLAAKSDHELDADQTLALVAQCPAEYAVVNRLAPRLEAQLGMRLLPGEKSFLALFLAAHRRRKTPSGLQVMVIAHGDTTASSMAAVANELLGTDVVSAVDMPLEQSVQATVELAAARVREVGNVRGVVLLVDMGSLTGLGPVLERETGVPFAVVPLVTTPAVIEAARVAREPGSDLAAVLRAVRRVYTGHEEEPVLSTDKRLVITTCLTGQGTARKLAAFLTEALPGELRESVTIQAVDLEKGSVLPGLLVEGWRKSVVAVVGTIDPHLPGVPFIGLERILFGDGLQALVDLLQGEAASVSEPSVTREEAMELATRFLVDNITSVDGNRAGEDAVAALRRFEESLGMQMNTNRVARWIIHLGFAIERLAGEGLVYPCPEEEYLKARHASLLSAIAEALAPIGQSWGFSFPPSEIAYMALIVLTE